MKTTCFALAVPLVAVAPSWAAPSTTCERVPLSGAYELRICALPETAAHGYPTAFRVQKRGKRWIEHVDVAGPTGGYNSKSTVKVHAQSKRFLALSFASDDIGSESVLALDLDKRTAKEISCPSSHCVNSAALAETHTCPLRVSCSPCIEAKQGARPTEIRRDLCAAPDERRAKGLPWDVPVEGNLVHHEVLEDKACEGLAVFSTKRVTSAKGVSVHLYADYYSDRCKYTKAGKPRIHRLRRVQDEEPHCKLDNGTAFDRRAFQVTDLDGNGHNELTFAYRLSCASDEGPSGLKLVLLERGKKYIIRGRTHGPGWKGKKEPGRALKKAPRVFRTHLDAVWDQLSPQAGFQPAN